MNNCKCKPIVKIYNSCYCKRHNLSKKKVKIINTKTIPLQDLSTRLVMKLNQVYSEITELDTVIIEQQPTKNVKMKNISHMLFCYFVLQNVNLNKECKILFVSPRNKLKIVPKEIFEKITKKEITKKNKRHRENVEYYNRKNIAKEYTQYYIEENFKDWISYYSTSKKKDDLADCLLQGIWFIQK